MTAVENLKASLAKWREGVKSARAEASRVRTKNPYGAQIVELNEAWGSVRREHEAAIADARREYQKKLRELTDLSNDWKAEYPTRPKNATEAGRPKNPDYSDEVKINAYLMFLETDSKAYTRSVMGINDNTKLMRVLEEGKALLQAQESEEEEW